jgi:amino acid permease
MNNGKPNRDMKDELIRIGLDLLENAKRIFAQASVRRLVMRKPNGEKLFAVPLLAAVAAAALIILVAPFLAAIAAVGALLAQVRVEIQREGPDDWPR